MRYHPVPIQFNEEEKIIGGKLTFRQIGFLFCGFILVFGCLFFLFFLPWYLVMIPMAIIAYQSIKFTFFKRFGWDYYIYWIKLRRCKKRQNQWLYRKTVRKVK